MRHALFKAVFQYTVADLSICTTRGLFSYTYVLANARRTHFSLDDTWFMAQACLQLKRDNLTPGTDTDWLTQWHDRFPRSPEVTTVAGNAIGTLFVRGRLKSIF